MSARAIGLFSLAKPGLLGICTPSADSEWHVIMTGHGIILNHSAIVRNNAGTQ